MKKILLLLITITLISCDAATLQKVLDSTGNTGITNTDIANGLKQALDKGIESGVDYLAKTDGFYKSPYKILLPEDAQKVVEKLRIIPGFNQVEDEITLKLNRAAEDAVKRAKPIFVDAIKQMTFTDVKNILMGEKNAATQYLHRTTYNKLYNEFHPVILESLNKFGAVDYWADAVNAYNNIPFVNKMNPQIDDYVTQKALAGVFDMVEKKELDIRTNIRARTTDLLRKVFSLQDR
ncbi:MAG TPA: DUF4197 domain-containing protein [Bacteroidetes bacterium]|nr:DUF4197 domain-containing protein [Bacteroidota bacterium]